MPHTQDQRALLAACRRLLGPLARLALSRGLTYASLDALLREVLVEQARALSADAAAHGLVSRISTATGLSRRVVGPLLKDQPPQPPETRWLAGEVFTRWLTDPDYSEDARPLVLARQGPAPSFESLAQAVTRDVHPRSLLEELCRLDMASIEAGGDTVSLRHDALVPRADFSRMVALLAANVGDHLDAAVDNVLGAGDAHFEQAVYADELSAESVGLLRPAIASQWQQLFARFVPELEQRIADDAASGRRSDQRVRIGLYSFAQCADPTAAGSAGDTPDATPEP